MLAFLSVFLGAALFTSLFSDEEREDSDETSSSEDIESSEPNLDLLDDSSSRDHNVTEVGDSFTPRVVSESVRGEVLGEDSDDHFIVYAETDRDMSKIWDGYFEREIPLEIRGGDGSDRFDLHGHGYVVDGDEGSDLININEASSVAVFAGHGDTVLGGSGSKVYVDLSVDAKFVGGEAEEFVISGSSAPAELGGGNDTFFGVASTSILGHLPQIVFGEEGDDYLQGSGLSSNLWYAHPSDEFDVSHDSDSLFGGAGNDTLIGSHGDILSGGDGYDQFRVILDSDESFGKVIVNDFDSVNETLAVIFQGESDGGEFPAGFGPDGFLKFIVRDNADGVTICTSSGQELAQVNGISDMKVGVESWNSETKHSEFFDLNGSPIEQSECNVLILTQRLYY